MPPVGLQIVAVLVVAAFAAPASPCSLTSSAGPGSLPERGARVGPLPILAGVGELTLLAADGSVIALEDLALDLSKTPGLASMARTDYPTCE